MRFALKLIVGFLLVCSVTLAWADSLSPIWYSQGKNNEIKLRVDLFLTSTCEHCQKADLFFRDLEMEEPWLDVHHHVINQDKRALLAFQQYLQQLQSNDFSVPAIFFCDSKWVGFADANTGKSLLRGLKYCQQQIAKTGQLTPVTVNVLRQWANANWLDTSIKAKPSTVTFVLIVALIDALNPCSFFCLMVLFAFLWLTKGPKKQISLGFLFLLTMGFVHFIQQRYTAFFYQLQPWFTIPTALIGLGLLIYLYRAYFNKGNQKQAFFLPILVVLTAFVIQAYQQTCVPNFSQLFEQWLVSNQFSLGLQWLGELSYQILYLLPLVLVIVIFVFLRNHNRFAKYQPALMRTAYIILVITALILVTYPQRLASFSLSFVVLIISIVAGWLITRRSK